MQGAPAAIAKYITLSQRYPKKWNDLQEAAAAALFGFLFLSVNSRLLLLGLLLQALLVCG